MGIHKPILIIDDNTSDILLLERALKRINFKNKIFSAFDGEEAISFLENPLNEVPLLILLDLNMPKMNGLEFLRSIKTQSRIKDIPIIILTGSNEERDRQESFLLGVSGYLIKPVDPIQLIEVMKTIDIYSSSHNLS
ncbi:MAG: response regulator [Bacteroidales bacterium]|nr:response regulator [Bacteroidales bacterium]